jgi:ATP-dependent DNA ligase
LVTATGVTVRLSWLIPGRKAWLTAQTRNFAKNAYLCSMLKAFDFCIPTRGTKVPDRPEWLHEIKYDGYRLRVERDGDRVRLITRNGYDWTGAIPGSWNPRSRIG